MEVNRLVVVAVVAQREVLTGVEQEVAAAPAEHDRSTYARKAAAGLAGDATCARRGRRCRDRAWPSPGGPRRGAAFAKARPPRTDPDRPRHGGVGTAAGACRGQRVLRRRRGCDQCGEHARAPSVRVTVEADSADGILRVGVRDDGAGGADFTGGSGLVGLKDPRGGARWPDVPRQPARRGDQPPRRAASHRRQRQRRLAPLSPAYGTRGVSRLVGYGDRRWSCAVSAQPGPNPRATDAAASRVLRSAPAGSENGRVRRSPTTSRRPGVEGSTPA